MRVYEVMSNLELAFLKPEQSVTRMPAGRICRVLEVERPKRVRIRDAGASRTFWVSWQTMKDKWRLAGSQI